MKKTKFKSKISNMKGSSGITLVALIITIIILLILAVVAIGAVNNTSIIQYAQNAKDEYKDGRDEENTTLGNYMDVLKHYNSQEEILWVLAGSEDDGYELYFIGNVEELDLSQDKEVKAYVATFNEETEEIQYGEITTVKISDAFFVDCLSGNAQTLKIGTFGLGDTNILEISFGDFGAKKNYF